MLCPVEMGLDSLVLGFLHLLCSVRIRFLNVATRMLYLLCLVRTSFGGAVVVELVQSSCCGRSVEVELTVNL